MLFEGSFGDHARQKTRPDENDGREKTEHLGSLRRGGSCAARQTRIELGAKLGVRLLCEQRKKRVIARALRRPKRNHLCRQSLVIAFVEATREKKGVDRVGKAEQLRVG